MLIVISCPSPLLLGGRAENGGSRSFERLPSLELLYLKRQTNCGSGLIVWRTHSSLPLWWEQRSNLDKHKTDEIIVFFYRCVAELTAGTARSKVSAENGFCIQCKSYGKVTEEELHTSVGLSGAEKFTDWQFWILLSVDGVIIKAHQVAAWRGSYVALFVPEVSFWGDLPREKWVASIRAR